MMNVPPESERIRQNFLKRQDQLHFAEECAYSADRQNTTSAVQIARRLNEATNIGYTRRAPAKPETLMIRYRVAEILFHHCTQSPHDTRFTPIWLHRAYDAVHPNDTVSREQIRSAIEHLINVTAVSTSTPTPPAAPRRILAVNNPSRLVEIMHSNSSPDNRFQAHLQPATLRSELHRIAEHIASPDREYDTTILMAAAMILRDPDNPSPPPTPLLPPDPYSPKDFLPSIT